MFCDMSYDIHCIDTAAKLLIFICQTKTTFRNFTDYTIKEHALTRFKSLPAAYKTYYRSLRVPRPKKNVSE